MNHLPESTSEGMISRRPWLLVVFAFVLLLGAWSTLITIALKNSPEPIQLHQTIPAATR